MEFDWNLGPLGEGLRCYRREEFFVAHEHWEILWRKSQGAEKSFLQALIQMAGGFHHWQRHNLKGATALLKAALRRLEAYPARYQGVEVAGLREELSRWLTSLEEAALEKEGCASGCPAKDAAPAEGACLPFPQLCVEVAPGEAAPEKAGKQR